MKILLDSSFFFPFIRVQVEGCTTSSVLEILESSRFTIFRSELVVFEISAKGSKYVQNNVVTIDDLVEGINTNQFLPAVHVVPLYPSAIQVLAVEFRRNHSNFIDCLTLASAVIFCDAFVTMDSPMNEKNEEEWTDLIARHNDHFKIITWKELEDLWKQDKFSINPSS
jgi:predicted nucleic acid-binding protein